LGAVGRAAKWRLEGLGLAVVAFDPYSEEATVSLDELLEVSDVVSMHAPVTPETSGMIGTAQFEAMKDRVIYLNTARARLHDTDALVEALRTGHVGGAGLDHFEGEQLAADHPLTAMTNVVLTPHIGGATWDTECRQATIVADELSRLMAGQALLHLVNPEVLA
jgi:D-3-phosphoglycerate dehydrogenase